MNNAYGRLGNFGMEDVMGDASSDTAKTRWIPTALEEGFSGINVLNVQSKHFSNRRLFLTGEVNDAMAIDFVSEFKYLADSDESVDIYLNSCGGSVNAGLVIYDLIQAAPFEINIYCFGMAASMGAVILAGGRKGHRFIMPHSKVMIHEPLIAGGFGGSATSVKKTSDSILETKDIINGILSRHTGKSIEEINEATAFDNYMNAEEAIKFGLCDEIKEMI